MEKSISKQGVDKKLAWHCHFIQKLYDEPEIEYENMNRAYDGLRENSFNESYYEAFKNGSMDIPLLMLV